VNRTRKKIDLDSHPENAELTVPSGQRLQNVEIGAIDIDLKEVDRADAFRLQEVGAS
jgi:hypothetical protein